MYLIPGIILTPLAIITTIIASNDLTSTLYAAIFVTAFSMTCYSRSLKAYGNIKEAFIYASFTNIFSALGSLLILIPLLIITIIGIMFFSGQISFIKIFLLFILKS